MRQIGNANRSQLVVKTGRFHYCKFKQHPSISVSIIVYTAPMLKINIFQLICSGQDFHDFIPGFLLENGITG